MKIGIGLKKHAYTPEAYAYSRFLTEKGATVQLLPEEQLDPENDLNLFVMGVRPFWKCRSGSAMEIHEYQNLSTPPAAHLKNRIKRAINRRPVGRIFLNEVVERGLHFSDDLPRMFREMGVDEALFQKPLEHPEFDLLYCGSIEARPGLLEELERLTSLGFKLLVVGEVSAEARRRVSKGVVWAGRTTREELPELYRNCRAGLNYTSNTYPFNVQTSTKALEYLASGLRVVSTRYHWAEEFFRERGGESVVWLERVNAYEEFAPIKTPDWIEELAWGKLLERSGLWEFLNSALERSR